MVPRMGAVLRDPASNLQRRRAVGSYEWCDQVLSQAPLGVRHSPEAVVKAGGPVSLDERTIPPLASMRHSAAESALENTSWGPMWMPR
jgi:hypothetical protein